MTASALVTDLPLKLWRAKWSIVFAFAGFLVAVVLGALSNRPSLGMAMACLLAALLLVLLVPSGWMAVLITALPFSDYVADRIRFPFIVGPPARFLLLVLLIGGIGRHLTAQMRINPSPTTMSSNANFIILSSVLVLTIFLVWTAYARSSDRSTVLAFGVDVFVVPVLAYWALSSCFSRTARIKPLIWAATASLGLEVAFGVYEYITHKGVATVSGLVSGPQQSFGISDVIIGVRADGSFLRADDYAIFCGAVGLLLIGYWLANLRWRQAFIVALLGATGCFASGLRGILIPYVMISAAMFLLSSGRVWTRLFVFMGAAFVVSVFFLPRIDLNSYGVYRERFKNTESIYTRVASYKTAIAVFKNHLVAGVGIGNYVPEASRPENVRFYRGSASVPFTHNSFLAFLADGGIICGGIYIVLFWAIIRRQVYGGPLALSAGLPIVLFFLASGLSLNLAYEPIPVSTTMVLAGLSHIMIIRGREEELRHDQNLTPQENEHSVLLYSRSGI